MSALSEPQGEIVAAIKFDANAANLLRAAASLAAASGRPLRLVHVFSAEYPVHGDMYGEFRTTVTEAHEELGPGEFSGWAEETRGTVYAHGFDYTMEQVQQRLSDLAKAYAVSGVITHTTVLVGQYPDALIEFAIACRASLIIAGAAIQNPGLLKSKLRHTYRLMAKSAVPVLVLPDSHAPLNVGTRPLRLLIGDDLTGTSEPALNTASELVTLLRSPVDVLHLHVEPLPTAGLALSAEHELEVWPGISVKDRLVNDHHDSLKERLRQRALALKAKVEAYGGTYAVQLWHGNVGKELSRAAQAHEADISVFGRHQFLHRQPLALGQLSFAAMLAVDSAILVAPN